MINNFKIGLALSGGGYRAAAFHLGTLKCLNKLGLLEKVDVISTISGGSIAGAYYQLHKDKFDDFVDKFIKDLQRSVIYKILLSPRFLFVISVLMIIIILAIILLKDVFAIFFTILLVIVITTIFLFKILPMTKFKEKAYKEIFFGNSTLNDFKGESVIAINCTNLDSGRLVTFSKDKFSDSLYVYNKGIKFRSDNIPVAFAVACSTAVPFLFHPMTIPKEFFINEKDYVKVSPALVDGGVYDNQGIHKLTEKSSSYKCDIIICSDGSAPYKRKYHGFNPLQVMMRVIETLMVRIKHFQFANNIYSKSEEEIKEIAYFSLNWNYESVITGFVSAVKSNSIRKGVLDAHNLGSYSNDEELTKSIKNKIHYQEIIKSGLTDGQINNISKISTNLHTLKEKQIKLLSTHAEILTELHIRLYCPSLFIS